MGKATFGEVIRERRRQLNLTQREVADCVGTSTPYIGHLETDKRHPSEEIVARMADVLGFERKELFFLANPKAHAIVATPTETSANSAWEEFQRNEHLRESMRVTTQEMEMLSRVALMGEVRSTRDFLYILNTVRQALTSQ
ncbi:MAG TPA: helix-turn-helix transcriptional regulator [Candidatus Binataceae bacterium]|nr:helix-turn-helix transcriptional regulator [Candidatus Binataceae bacterium]